MIQLRQQASSRLETWRHLRDVTYHDLPISVPGWRCQGTGISLNAGAAARAALASVRFEDGIE